MSALAESIETPSEPVEETSIPVDNPSAEGWRQDKKGRWFIGAKGRAGVIYRKGDESVDEAIQRDQDARESGRPPKSKPKTEKAPAPTRKTSKELELALTESLQAPAMLAGLHGDEWVANHLYVEAPTLARNLVAAAEHNPKFRTRLEAIAGGETAFGQFILQIAVANALVAYALPPVLYYLGDRAPARMRETFQVPPKPAKPPRPTPEEELADMEQIRVEMQDAAPEGA